MTKNCVCRTPYQSKHTSYDCVFCCTSLKWWHLQMLFSFFQNFSFLGCWGKCSHCISQELYIIWLWFLVHMCKMMISPAIFFHFFKILIFRVFQSSSINAKQKFWGMHHLLRMCRIFFKKKCIKWDILSVTVFLRIYLRLASINRLTSIHRERCIQVLPSNTANFQNFS